jgi:hypothetical protein
VDRDLYRAALAIACAFAVVLGASLFPATGFGANPVPAATGGNGTGNAPGAGTGGQQTPNPTATTTTEDATDGTSNVPHGTKTGSSDDDQNGSRSGDGGTGNGANTATTTTAAPAPGNVGDDTAGVELLDTLFALFAALVALSLGVVLPAVGLGRHHRRRNPAQWDLPSAPHLRVLEYVRRIPQTSLAFVLFAGTNAPGILDGLASSLSTTGSGLAGATAGLGNFGAALGRGLLKAPIGLVTGIGTLGRGIGSLTLGLGALTSLGSGSILGRPDSRPREDPRSDGSEDAVDPPEPDPPEPPASVSEAWERLQEDLGVRGRDGETPGEIARTAIDRGLPRNPVRALTRAFREVRYGGRPDDAERVHVARNAYERLRTAIDGEGDSQ